MLLSVKALSAEAFKPFGERIAAPKGKPTASLPGMDYWADLARLPLLERPYGIGYATQDIRPFRQTGAERHMKTPELLLPVRGDMVVIVGPPDNPQEPSRLPPLSRFSAFLVKEGEGVLFAPGTWHWAPFALRRAIGIFVIYSTGTAESDATVVDFPKGEVLEFTP
jgi:ureidoglycolate hydrolase